MNAYKRKIDVTDDKDIDVYADEEESVETEETAVETVERRIKAVEVVLDKGTTLFYKKTKKISQKS